MGLSSSALTEPPDSVNLSLSRFWKLRATSSSNIFSAPSPVPALTPRGDERVGASCLSTSCGAPRPGHATACSPVHLSVHTWALYLPPAAVRKAAAHTGACVDRAVSALGRHLGAELPDHMGSLRVTFGGPARLFPPWPPHFTSPAPTRQRGRVPVLHVLVSTCCHLTFWFWLFSWLWKGISARL